MQNCSDGKADGEIAHHFSTNDAERPVIADDARRERVKECGADEAQGYRFKHGGDKCRLGRDAGNRADVLECGEAERGDDHIDHRVHRFSELRVFVDSEMSGGKFHNFFDGGKAKQ